MHFFAKLWYLCDSHGLPSCKACLVAIQVSYWCADFSLSVPRLFGLSLFKNSHTWRQTKVLSSFCFLVKISIVVPSLTYWSSFGGWKGFTLCASYLSVHICVLDVSHRHCREVVGDVFVCLCVCVAKEEPHDSMACPTSHLHLYLSFFVLHNCVIVSVPRQMCTDTVRSFWGGRKKMTVIWGHGLHSAENSYWSYRIGRVIGNYKVKRVSLFPGFLYSVWLSCCLICKLKVPAVLPESPKDECFI